MEVDLTKLATKFTKENFEEKFDDCTVQSITEWLSKQLQKERQGWKSKMHDALQEVDRERRQSLAAHAQIEELNARLEPHMDNMTIHREPSMYAAVETDEKTNVLEHLQKNLEAVLRRLHCVLQERSECLNVLSFNQRKLKDAKLQDLLRNHINQYEAKVMNTIDLSRKEIIQMSSQLAQQERKYNEITDKNFRIQERLEREISRLNKLLLEQKEYNFEEKIAEMACKGTQVEGFRLSRDCCIQVDLDLEKRPESNRLTKEPVFSVDNCHNHTEDKLEDTSFGRKSISDLQENKLLGECNAETNDVEVPFETTLTNALTCQPFYLTSRGSTNLNSKDNVSKDVNFLRHQVTDLAVKLKKTKHDLDSYEKQLTTMKIGFTNKVIPDPLKSPISNKSVDSLKHMHENNNETNGYLTGIPEEILFPNENKLRTQESLHLHSHFRKTKGNKAAERNGFMASSVTTKCLRCYKVYTVRDNHKMACRYHTKGKKKIEKYDEKGKLVMVNYLWECCSLKPEALGCRTGEHI